MTMPDVKEEVSLFIKGEDMPDTHNNHMYFHGIKEEPTEIKYTLSTCEFETPDSSNMYTSDTETVYFDCIEGDEDMQSDTDATHEMYDKNSTPNISRHGFASFDSTDSDVYCHICKKRFANKLSYQGHARRKHALMPSHYTYERPSNSNMPLGSSSCKATGFRCLLCDEKFDSWDPYEIHTKSIHNKMLLKGSKAVQIPGVNPDLDDPDNYCRSCTRKYDSQKAYRSHLQRKHNDVITRATLIKRRLNSGAHPNPDNSGNYCQSCDTLFTSKGLYRAHLRSTHKMKLAPTYSPRRTFRPTPGVLPDPDSPDFYCRSCNAKFDSRSVYRAHLKRVHKLTLGAILVKRNVPILAAPESDAPPVPYVPDYSCGTCNIKFNGTAEYREHMRCVHGKRFRREQPDTTIVPDSDDPNNYCRSCNAQFDRIGIYRVHLRKIHKMSLEPIRKRIIPIPSIIPDLEDPNFYCKSCNITLRSRGLYRAHLRVKHRMTIEPLYRKNSLPASGTPS